MRLVAATILAVVRAVMIELTLSAESYPLPYPRPGATTLLDDYRVRRDPSA
jgi:hypothetical protein